MKRVRPRSYKSERSRFLYRGRHQSPARTRGPVFDDLLVVTRDPVCRRASNHLKERLAQAFKLLRLYDNGQLPVPIMRALDEMKVKLHDQGR